MKTHAAVRPVRYSARPPKPRDRCRASAFDLPISMAFQPIVNIRQHTVFAHEALVRGVAGEGALSILSRVTPDQRYAFDQCCRTTAIAKAAAAGIGAHGDLLSINVLPNAIYHPELCIRATLEACDRFGVAPSLLLFEFSESERTLDTGRLKDIVQAYTAMGFRTAIDDFGAGYSGLALLADFQPDLIKLDMQLIRGIDQSHPRRVLVDTIVSMAKQLGAEVVAEGIETLAEAQTLVDLGIVLMQGYLFAKPAFEAQAQVVWPFGTQRELFAPLVRADVFAQPSDRLIARAGGRRP